MDMKDVVSDSALVLDTHETIELIDAAGATATLDSGCLWITMDGDRRDIVLRAGDHWTVERNGLTLVHAAARSTLRIERPVKGRATVGHSAWDRFCATLRRALERHISARNFAPYL